MKEKNDTNLKPFMQNTAYSDSYSRSLCKSYQ